MRKSRILAVVLIALLGISTACAAGTPSATPGSSPKTGLTGPVSSKETEWEALVKAAQQEGTLNVYAGTVPAGARTAAQQAFKQKYGINIEYTPGLDSEIVQKFKAELGAGLHIVDVMQTGPTVVVNDIKPLNVTTPMEPLLVLPEVLDQTKWVGGHLPFFDTDKHALMIMLVVNNFFAVNKDSVKENEITATSDLLDPKWKGQIDMLDPSIPGNAAEWFTHTMVNVMGNEKGEKFMRELVKQEPVISRDNRQLTEWVARGKYRVGIGISQAMVAELLDAGAPLAFADIKEPRGLSPGAGVVYSFKNVPHPSARKLFVNWFFSKEGSSIYAPAHGYPSSRVDVPTQSFASSFIPRQGDIMPDEKYMLKKNELMKVAGEIFGGLSH